MNKLMRKCVGWMLIVFLSFTAVLPCATAESIGEVVGNEIAPEDYLFYTITEQGIVIDYYDGSFSEFFIPETIGGLPVIEIGSEVFANRGGAFSIGIPASITDIAEDAFAGSPDVELLVEKGSAAEAYAQSHALNYAYVRTAEAEFDFSSYYGNWSLVYISINDNVGDAESLGIAGALSIVDDGSLEIDIGGNAVRCETEVVDGKLAAHDGESQVLLEIDEKGHLIVNDGVGYLEFEKEETGNEGEKAADPNDVSEEIPGNVSENIPEEVPGDVSENIPGESAGEVSADSLNGEGYIGEWELKYIEREGARVAAADENIYGSLIVKEDGSVELIQDNNCDFFTWEIWNDGIYIRETDTALKLDDQGNLLAESLVFVRKEAAGDFFGFYANSAGSSEAENEGTDETVLTYEIVDMAAGYQHSVALRGDGTVVAAGGNSNGECDIEAWTDVAQVAAGMNYTVGLTSDGKLLTAGKTPEISVTENIRSIFSASGSYHIAAVTQDGAVVTSRGIVLEDGNYVQAAAASQFVAALREDGTVAAAGESYYDELEVESWENIVQVAVGAYHTVGLRADGTVVATGYNKNDQCEVMGWENIVSVAAGSDFSVGIDADGAVHIAAYEKNSTIEEIEGWTDIVKVSVGGTHALGLKSDGTVVAVGINNRYGTCDTYDMKDAVAAVTEDDVTAVLKRDGSIAFAGDDYGSFDSVSAWPKVKQIDMGSGFLVGLTDEGRVFVEGFIRGNEKDATYWTDIEQIAAGSGHIVGLKKDGTVVAAGYNDNGECDVGNWSGICRVAAGNCYTLGLKKDGTVVAAGANQYSQRDVSDWRDISGIYSDWYCSIGITESGTIRMAGDVDDYSAAAGWSDIVQAAATSDHMVALKADGTVLSVGDNDCGQCDTESWRDIVWVGAGLNVTVGVKADGTVVATGKGHNKGGKCDVQTWGIPHEAEAEAEPAQEADYVKIQTSEPGRYELPAMTDATEYRTADSYNYSLFDDGSAILLYKNCRYMVDTKLVLPDQVDGHPVIAIGTEFLDCGDVLTEIVVPDSVVYIDDLAFDGCSGLEKITLGDGVVDMGANPFVDCEALETIEISADHPYLEVRGNILIQKPRGKIIARSRMDTSTSYTIPEDIRMIGGYALAHNPVRTVELPETLEWIGENAFYNSALQSIEIPGSVKVLGDYALYNCIYLAKVALPETMEAIGDYAFGRCHNMMEIDLPDQLKQIGSFAFEGCSAVRELNLPASTLYLGDYVFSYCRDLENVSVNGNFEYIGANPFHGCEDFAMTMASENPSLTIQDESLIDLSTKKLVAYLGVKREYVVPDGIQIIGGGAFKDANLVKVTLPDGVVEIADSAFENCEDITGLIMPDTVERIGSKAFNRCSSLKELSVSKNLISIGEEAFYDCAALEALEFGESLETIGNRAFLQCISLSAVNFPDSLKSIGENAFLGCSALTEVVLKGNGLNVMDWAFSNTGLKKVTVGAGVDRLGEGSFYSLEELKQVTFEPGITSIGVKAFYNCEFIEEIVLPEGLTTIEDEAFYVCSNLRSLSLPESLTSIGSGAFRACDIAQVVVPAAVTTMGEGVFAGCDRLTSAEFHGELAVLPAETFDNCTALSNVVFAKGLKEIGTKAFGGCDSLGDFDFPDGLEIIGDTAFYSCNGIFDGEMVVPDTVRYIGTSAFSECGLYKVTFPDSHIEFGGNPFPYGSDIRFIVADDHPTIRVIDGVLFSTVNDSLIYFPRFDEKLEGKTYSVPQGTKIITDQAFYYPCNIDGIILPDSLTTIGKSAFASFYGLRSIELPAGVQQIGEYAFRSSISLQSITLPESITEIAYGTFDRCESLMSIRVPASVRSINDYAFNDCAMLNEVILAEGLETIGSHAFGNCESLSRIRIPRSVYSISRDCFFSYGSDPDHIDVTLEVYEGSYAYMYAQAYGFDFEIVEGGSVSETLPAQPVQFADHALEAMVRSALGMTEDEEFDRETLNEIDELLIGLNYDGNLFTMCAGEKEYGTETCYYLTSLEDLKWFPNLKRLLMSGLISGDMPASEFLATIPDSIALDDIEISEGEMDFSAPRLQSVLQPVSVLILSHCNVTNFDKMKEAGRFDILNLWDCELDTVSNEELLNVYLECECSRMLVDGEALTFMSFNDFEITTNTMLEKGDRNTSVQMLQSKLVELGYLDGAADGIFGTMTEAAVKAAQSDLGMEQTGKANGGFLSTLFMMR